MMKYKSFKEIGSFLAGFRDSSLKMRFTRRGFLKMGALTTMGLMSHAADALAMVRPAEDSDRSLSFYNLHTEESLQKTYFYKDRYVPKTLQEIDYILRDFRAKEVHPIDVKLLDLLFDIKRRLGAKEPFLVISGYRSPATNEYLREHSRGVAAGSLHMFGKAIDIRLPSVSLETLHKTAVSLRLGGVGYYPSSDFVHVDVGNVRYW